MEAMVFNQENNFNIKANNGEIIINVDGFKYLGSYIGSSIHDVKVRKALSQNAKYLEIETTSKIKKQNVYVNC